MGTRNISEDVAFYGSMPFKNLLAQSFTRRPTCATRGNLDLKMGSVITILAEDKLNRWSTFRPDELFAQARMSSLENKRLHCVPEKSTRIHCHHPICGVSSRFELIKNESVAEATEQRTYVPERQSPHLSMLEMQASALRQALDKSKDKESEINAQIERTESALERSRLSASIRIARLRAHVAESELSYRKFHTRRSIVFRNTAGVVKTLKVGLSDPPEDKDELEMEATWEVNVQISAMEAKWKELAEQQFVVRTARAIHKEKLEFSVSQCVRTLSLAGNVAEIVERTYHPVTSSKQHIMMEKLLLREVKVKILNDKVVKMTIMIRQTEIRLACIRRKVNCTHMVFMKRGHLSRIALNSLQDLTQALIDMNGSKEMKTDDLTDKIALCYEEELALRHLVDLSRRRAHSMGCRPIVSCEQFSRFPIKPPEDFAQASASIDYGCQRKQMSNRKPR